MDHLPGFGRVYDTVRNLPVFKPVTYSWCPWCRVPRVRDHPLVVLHHLTHPPYHETEKQLLDQDLIEKIGLGTEANPFVIYRDPQSVNATNLRHLRFVCVSDTHNKLDRIVVPHGDVFVHCGDAVNHYTCWRDLPKFNECVGKLPHKHKLFVSGNHCITLNPERPDLSQQILGNMTYIQDQLVDIEGVSIYGSPWRPERGRIYLSEAFGYDATSIRADIWSKIPENIDILMTHSPPYSIRDYDPANEERLGCPGLLSEVVTRVKPRVHLFGHMHADWGVSVYKSDENSALVHNIEILSSHDILFANLSIKRSKRILGEPVVIDYFY
ncbi:unnamed protein product [Rotaria sp. Silwood1]|nr:unnamed protein product [Rotaria sp. Silwood1]CAF3436016.1 unnamed protein product [Rotaria sp. Silwood1]CAF3485954.1 unnamed protein product [Rotaria sp. Silwood1]CAF4704736.1 unnamed protein product [Rotaria sp. Silwood1]CAF4928192.1 unnamed protein product [Rotaria sp. Silwood1]